MVAEGATAAAAGDVAAAPDGEDMVSGNAAPDAMLEGTAAAGRGD